MTDKNKKIIEQINSGIIPDGYKKTKVGIVPIEWEVIKLGDVCEIIMGQSPNSQNYNNKNIGLPLIQGNADIYENHLSPHMFTSIITKTCEINDIIMSVRAPVGAVVIADIKACIGRGVCAIRTFENQKYIYQYLLYFKNKWKNISQGSTFESINSNQIYNLSIPLSPIEEQTAIAEILSTQDKLIELYERKIEQLKTLKKGYLQKMFPKKGCKYPELRFKGFTDDWEQRKLGEIMNVTSVKRIHQSDWTYSGVRFLRARDIVAAYKNEKSSDYLYISQDKYEEYSSLCGKVNKGDLLVTGVGTIGVPMLINDENPLYFKDGNIIWFQNENKINANFLYYSFIGNAIQSFIQKSAGTGTVGTYTIDSGKKTPIALPKYMTEQHQIGAFFANLDRLITLHQHKLDKEKQKKKALMQLLLTGKVRVST